MTKPTPEDVRAALQAAATHLNAGRYADSIMIADRILQQFPNHPDALHVSGLSRLKMGQPRQALAVLDEALRAKKSDEAIANNLALTHLALGEVDQAADVLKPFARKNKLSAPSLNTLGDCRLRQGEPGKAKACFEKALKLDAKLDAARVNLGEALKESGDLAGAIAHYTALTKSHPHLLSAWRNFGLALQDAERFEESIPPLRHYLTLNPTDVASRMSLGSGYSKTGQFEAALEQFDEALKLEPANAEAWSNRGVALRTLGRTDDAAEAFRRALALDNNLASARSNLAHMLHETEGIDAALVLLDEAVALAPEDPKAHMSRCQALLAEGRIAEGWADYGWRFQTPTGQNERRDHGLPEWNGDSLAGKTVLVCGEQGIGDEIVYASMVPDLLKTAGHVAVECASRLVPLFERSFPAATIVPKTSPSDPSLKNLKVDCQTAAGSVCQFLRPDFESFTGGDPYLKADDAVTEAFRQRYRDMGQGKPVIGIAWRSGRPVDAWIKTIPLEWWTPLLRDMDATCVSLQYGDCTTEIDASVQATGRPIFVDPDVDSLKDLDAYAAQVASVDLVISNSNTAAHMSGALGVPTWTIVPKLGSGGLPWHWFKDRTDSPWYKAMTVYRQTNWHDWTDVMAQVSANLPAFLASR